MSSSFEPFEQAMRDLAQRLASRQQLRESVLSRLVLHVATRMADSMDEPLKSHGLNTTLWTSLVVIYAAEGHRLKPSELSVFMNSSRTNSTRVAKELERQGFVERIGSELDRRQVFLQLTPRALEFVKENMPRRRTQLKEMFEGFEPQEVDELERLLRKLLTRFS
ncbi:MULTISPECIES: MarR family transcriptional regulator [unclassified Achromobacter]|uniref:MarR family transcriptional regulator n=1 Tax=unclassified Achromobacter TaxID=2626865 RepID=UPI000B519D58|nr:MULTISPECIES: MarR family transcriptional regulator [unclassified Achromobacter]OWT75777.1 MarR family transcriptional regulator [Achromobacter sp. HZ28]OWT76437.1 MarR family transcriptional regulator [Achromobacter sp. HZ34]